MQINVCRKCIVFQNSALYDAAILKFEIYAFISQSELFKLRLILIQVYAKNLVGDNMPMLRLRLINELWANNDYVII